MANTGFKSPSTNTLVVDGADNVIISDPDNAHTQNNTSASASLGKGDVSDRWRYQGFGFTTADIPANSVIDGILVSADSFASGQATLQLYLYDPVQDIYSSVKQIALPDSTDTNTYYTAGGATDLWGLSLVDTDVTSSTFGVAVEFAQIGGFSSATGFLDHIRIDVYYTPANIVNPDTATLTLSSDGDPTEGLKYARPDEDIATGSWTASTGSNFWELVNSVEIDDSTYIECLDGVGETTILELGFSKLELGQYNEGVVLFVRAGSITNDNYTMTITIISNGVNVTSEAWQVDGSNGANDESYNFPDIRNNNINYFRLPLTAAQTSTIDPANLSVRFQSNSGMASSAAFRIYQTYFEAPPVTGQILEVDTTVSQNGWTVDGAANPVNALSDGEGITYVQGTSSTSGPLIMGFENGVNPNIGINHIVSFSFLPLTANDPSSDTLTVSLYEGTTLIATLLDNWFSEIGTIDCHNIELTTEQANSITDYTNLRIHFESSVSSSNEGYRIYYTRLYLPTDSYTNVSTPDRLLLALSANDAEINPSIFILGTTFPYTLERLGGIVNPSVGLQVSRPIADRSTGGWTVSTGTDFFAVVDEETANDATYVECANNVGENTSLILTLDPVLQPLNNEGLVLVIRMLDNSDGRTDVTVSLNESTIPVYSIAFQTDGTSTFGVSDSFPEVTNSTWGNFRISIPTSDVATISNFGDLEVEILVSNQSGGEHIRISQVYLEVPPYTGQNGFPTSVITQGGWDIGGGAGTVVAALQNEDGTYMRGLQNDTSLEVLFDTLTDPVSSSDHIVTFGISATDDIEVGEETFVYLYQGATLIATMLNDWFIDHSSFVEHFNYVLTPTEADNITDYSDLRIRITNDPFSTSSEEYYDLHYAHIYAPAAVVVGTGSFKYWNGSAWVLGTLKYWNGSAWVEKPVKYWDGAAWSEPNS